MGISEEISKVGIDIGVFSGGLGNVIVWLIGFIVLAIVVGIGTYMIINKRNYDKTIQVFEEVSGKTTLAFTDKAREMTIPGTGIRVFKLKNHKYWLPRPTIQFSKNLFLYFLRKDGTWINLSIENLNETLDELKVDYDHTDMKYANASLKELIKENFGNHSWLKEYAPYIAMGMLIIFLGITFYLVADRIADAAASLSGSSQINAKATEQLTKLTAKLLDRTANSGIR